MEPYNRSKSSSVRYARWQHSVNVSSNFQFTNTIWNANQVTSSSLNGWTNPLWREQVRDHRPATTSCSGIHRSLDPGWFEVRNVEVKTSGPGPNGPTQYNMQYGNMYDTNGNSFPSIPSLPTSALANAALTRFYSDANRKINQASGMIALGELRDTVRMLKHPFRSLRDLLVKREKSLKGKWNRLNRVRSVKERKILGKDLKNAVTGTWLEVQFGLKPLCSDIEDLVTYLQFRRFQLGVEFYPIRGSARLKGSVENDASWISGNGSRCWYQKKRRTETDYKVRYKGQIKIDPLEPGVTWKDFSRLGLSLRQFAPTLWEITPWSFVVDYFTNIGDLIDSFNVPRENIVWFNCTRRSETKQTMWLTGLNSGREAIVRGYVDPDGFQSYPSTAIARQFDRAGDGQFQLPRPKISFDLPSGKKIVNLFALAANDSRRRFSNPL